MIYFASNICLDMWQEPSALVPRVLVYWHGCTRNTGYEIASKMAEEVEFVSDEEVPELKRRMQSQISTVRLIDYLVVSVVSKMLSWFWVLLYPSIWQNCFTTLFTIWCMVSSPYLVTRCCSLCQCLGLGVDSKTPVSGSTVFGFQTPKRRGALAEAGKFA